MGRWIRSLFRGQDREAAWAAIASDLALTIRFSMRRSLKIVWGTAR